MQPSTSRMQDRVDIGASLTRSGLLGSGVNAHCPDSAGETQRHLAEKQGLRDLFLPAD